MSAPKSSRLHIAFFGRRNVGKSSLLNALTRQQVSIVSPVAGTTTDPVEKPMELLPLGPVLFIDTAGIDDEGALGALRVQKTRQVLDRTDLGLVVAEAGRWSGFEEDILSELLSRNIPAIVVFNKADAARPEAALAASLAGRKLRVVETSAIDGGGVADLRQALLDLAPADFINSPPILGDLVGPGELALLVVPIDKEAPKGRLILPQVQAIRDLLDSDAFCLVVKERELRAALDRLKSPPRLVVTDSQAFLKVAADTPRGVPLTSFSILMARAKGDLPSLARGAAAIGRLRTGDRVLVAEACSHHPIGEDIGRVKIPRWLTQYVGGKLCFDHAQGHDFPADLTPYKLVIHCGGCMFNRREMLSRMLRCARAGVPITNYGLAIAYSLGIFERALEPFPAALEACRTPPHRDPLPGAKSERGLDLPGAAMIPCGSAPAAAMSLPVSGQAPLKNEEPRFNEILAWLRETDPRRLEMLWARADDMRRARVGDAVHLRGLIEISNHCARQCAYCGLRVGNRGLARYRLSADEISGAARQALEFGYGTVVLQSGEDYGIKAEWIAGIVRRIKAETGLAVTLSLGERGPQELDLWRKAGADRYLLRFETSDRALFDAIHPSLGRRPSDRLDFLRRLKDLGYETGSGIMVGLPGQTYESVARDLCLFRTLDLDMIGIGPFIPHPQTPLGNGAVRPGAVNGEQAPNTELMVLKAVALARLAQPDANIPSTTALATINKLNGRELGLKRGANVLMPNLTPLKYRSLYQIYPAKVCIQETGDACNGCLRARLAAIGRSAARGPGGRRTIPVFARMASQGGAGILPAPLHIRMKTGISHET
jgi:[FeFe] hydrogenase H-cluster maturation GTPase HydF/[FeFe] hydrogenase H-cluster radical SAM maturase HydE